MTEQPYITTQVQNRSNRYVTKPDRWAYVLHLPGEWPYVSVYRYGSEAAARKAGERDLVATLAFMAEES